MSVFPGVDPTGLVPLVNNIFQFVWTIVKKVREVKVNKQQCAKLKEHIERVSEYLKILDFERKLKLNGDALQKTLTAFTNFLAECHNFISKFTGKVGLKKFINSVDDEKKFDTLHQELDSLTNELTLGITSYKFAEENGELDDQRNLSTFMNKQQNDLIYAQQLFYQPQIQQIDQWRQQAVKTVGQHQITAPSIVIDPDLHYVNQHNAIELKYSNVSLSSENPFMSGTWSHQYLQNGFWHGPFKHQMTFNLITNTFEGYGKDNIGQFILKGIFAKDAKQVRMIQSYIYGTGNPMVNFGHQCLYHLVFNRKNQVFEGTMYSSYGWTIIPTGLFKMAFVEGD